ncbi:methyltransferase domain-containing protein [Solirubrobacter ginsenosidimutans]|uniref:Methyltransferase domain-containing protein n=1 Tax=Solirubrobacter ginsenosidimutans TaxID=490573 RepID=A0A9X3MYP0_9ACTN|nr:methyltransferase domain-containing protein [Solirubrobacter ginsenosidimutans]MDA0164066.1 methyltransferase domain-containing protein [Solirubrobacter ginsenosidimutans]
MACDDEPSDEHGRRAARTYAAAADHFNCPSLAFWDRYGAATVSRLNLSPGQAVLDLCCGAGASAIPAARAVGPAGTVIGIDVAAALLDEARARAEREGLRNVEFRLDDARSTGFGDGSFDAVVCVFGVFFVADMEAFVAEMWRLVRPGGTLAITTWGPGLWEPASSVFWETVREIEPSLYKAFNPWDEITTPDALNGLFERAGLAGAKVEAAAGEQRLGRPDDFWDVVLGSGYRATVDALDPAQREALHDRVITELRSRAVLTLRTDVVFGTADRPQDDRTRA